MRPWPGHNSAGFLERYQHITEQVRRDVAVRVGDLLWKPQSKGDGDLDDGTAGVLVRTN